jgi:hypothetical protein
MSKMTSDSDWMAMEDCRGVAVGFIELLGGGLQTELLATGIPL